MGRSPTKTHLTFLGKSRIRYDPLTEQASVLDAVRLVTGCNQAHASRTFSAVMERFPDVCHQVEYFKFPGQGQRPTPVAPLQTLLNIMAVAPGKKARKFSKATTDVFCRALGADVRLADEIHERRRTVGGTPLADAAQNVSTTVDDALAVLGEPDEPPEDEGVLYIVTSPLMSAFKLGFWTGTLGALRSRYVTCYGPSLELHTWPCTQCRACEQFLLTEFSDFSLGGELFDKTHMPAAIQFMNLANSM